MIQNQWGTNWGTGGYGYLSWAVVQQDVVEADVFDSAFGYPGPTNWAASSTGATASASSTVNSSYPVSSVIDGDRKGATWGNGGGWNDGTINVFPDWVQINFAAIHNIAQVVVYTLQDNFPNPSDPTDTMTFSVYGLTAFDVQIWDGSSWITEASVAGNTLVKRTVTFPSVATSAIRIVCNGGLKNYSRIVEIEAYDDGNVALATLGATVSASSTQSSAYPAGSIINGDRKGAAWSNGGGWNDATMSLFPDWIQVNFNGSQTINNVVVYTLQDAIHNPIEPTDSTTFTLYGLTAFDVQTWDGSTWVTQGSVTGNNLVKRRVVFPAVTTTAIRILCNNGLAGYSRIVEVEATLINGAVATASSSYSSAYPVSSIINGDRKGIAWGNGGGWNSATSGSFPDWVQINYNSTRAIGNVSVYTLQDNYSNPIEPTDSTTFSLFGLTAFDVQTWNGTAWVTQGSVVNNNLVKRTVSFSPVSTNAIRIICNNGLNGYSRIVEVEAY
ncbi:MAG: discoidin domain-containing protein [Rudaea sp.]|uniref:discoidin domain-containing protein n=1 Tax=Rudaea sp. TaxID=2136325 RepID=UPI0039E61E0F